MNNRKRQILEEGKRLFAEKGYASTGMRELAEAVGVEAPTLYSHFTNKAEILWQICSHKAFAFTQLMNEVKASELSPVDKIRKLLDLHIEMALTDPLGHAVFLHEWKYLHGAHYDRFIQMRAEYEKDFISIISSGMDAGKIRSVDPRLAFYTLINSVRWVHRWEPPAGTGLASSLRSLVLEGLLKR